MAANHGIANWTLGALGGIVGGVLGYFAFFLVARQGFYAMVLPGTLVGIGCGFLSGVRSTVLGIVAGAASLALGLFIEWRFAPFIDDPGLGYFVSHVHELKPFTLILIGLGGLCGFWFGRGREGGVGPRSGKTGESG